MIKKKRRYEVVITLRANDVHKQTSPPEARHVASEVDRLLRGQLADIVDQEALRLVGKPRVTIREVLS